MTKPTMTNAAATAPILHDGKQSETVSSTMTDTHAKKPVEKVSFEVGMSVNLDGPIDLSPHDNDVITQFKFCCAAGNLCDHKEIPVNRIHRCAACSFAVHAMCEVELKSSIKKKVESTSIKGVCRACLKRLELSCKLQQDANQVEYLSMHYMRVWKNVSFDWAKLVISDNDPYALADQTNDKNSDKANIVSGSPPGPNDMDTEQLVETVEEDMSTSSVATAKATTEGSAKNNTNTNNDNDDTNKKTAPVITKRFLDVHLNFDAPKDDQKTPAAVSNISINRCKEWVKEVQDLIPSFKLHTIDKDAAQEILHDLSQFPKNLGELKLFFKNIRPSMRGGKQFMKILVSFVGTEKTLINEIGWYHGDRKEMVRVAPIQAADSAVAGFFVYSTYTTDAIKLNDTLQEYTKCQVNCRWMRIADGTKYDPNRDTRNDPKALHVETAKENKESVKAILRKLYGAKAKKFPLHQRMRFVPTIHDLVDMDSLEKFQELKNRQSGWCRQHDARINKDFEVIDRKMKNSDLTLRDMIMTIPATTGNTSTVLFQSIDRAKNGGFHVSFHPDKSAEACMAIKSLYPRLLAKYGKGINSFFTTDAIDAGAKMEWDPKTNKVTSQDDRELASICGMDDDMTFAPDAIEAIVTAEDALPKRLTTYQPERGDDDSVSTLGTKRSANEGNQPQKKARTEIVTTSDDVSAASTLTTGTMKTRMSTMETQITEVNSSITQLGQLMRQMLERNLGPTASSLAANVSLTGSGRPNQLATTPEKNQSVSNNLRHNLSGDAETPSGASAMG